MERHFLLLPAITLLLVHEMDAICCKEWTIFPGLSRLPEKMGNLVFAVLHIPLIFLVLAGLAGGCLAHIGLHVLCHRLPGNGFRTSFRGS